MRRFSGTPIRGICVGALRAGRGAGAPGPRGAEEWRPGRGRAALHESLGRRVKES